MTKTLCDTCGNDAAYRLRVDYERPRHPQFQVVFGQESLGGKCVDSCAEHLHNNLCELLKSHKTVEVSR